jgi:hypothetical protein
LPPGATNNLMMFLYDLPNWLMGVLIVGSCVAFVLTAYFVFKKLVPGTFSDTQVSTSIGLVSVVATVMSLLLAFSAVSVWEAFNSADMSVTNEANDVSMLARDLASYGGEEALKTRSALREYATIVVHDEWQLMARKGHSEKAADQIDLIFHLAAKIESHSERDTVLLHEIWDRINQLTKHRRERLHISESEVPTTLWVVVLLGTTLTFLFTFVLPATRFNITLICGLAAAIGLVFFFIVAMDHPFAGKESISHEPFDSSIENMDTWDAHEKVEPQVKR